MEIAKGEYEIPLGCRAIVAEGKVYIFDRLIKGRRPGGRKHCKDCKHTVIGKACGGNFRTTYVCELRPKATWSNAKLFYAVGKYNEVCKHFQEQ
jgi:hypothetical protein